MSGNSCDETEKEPIEDVIARRVNKRMAAKVAAEMAERDRLDPAVKKHSNRPVVCLLIAIILSATAFYAPFIPIPQECLDLRQSILLLECYDEDDTLAGQGSCFVVTEKDSWIYAVTARHCVENYDPWGNSLSDVKWLKVDGKDAWVVRKDPDADVALIRFKSDKTYVPLSLADPVRGEECKTVGWTSGAFLQFKGHVAGWGFECGDDFYTVANTGLFPGCSGGVLLNRQNEVIGVTVAVPVYGGIWDTVGLYVPVKYVRALMETI